MVSEAYLPSETQPPKPRPEASPSYPYYQKIEKQVLNEHWANLGVRLIEMSDDLIQDLSSSLRYIEDVARPSDHRAITGRFTESFGLKPGDWEKHHPAEYLNRSERKWVPFQQDLQELLSEFNSKMLNQPEYQQLFHQLSQALVQELLAIHGKEKHDRRIGAGEQIPFSDREQQLLDELFISYLKTRPDVLNRLLVGVASFIQLPLDVQAKGARLKELFSSQDIRDFFRWAEHTSTDSPQITREDFDYHKAPLTKLAYYSRFLRNKQSRQGLAKIPGNRKTKELDALQEKLSRLDHEVAEVDSHDVSLFSLSDILTKLRSEEKTKHQLRAIKKVSEYEQKLAQILAERELDHQEVKARPEVAFAIKTMVSFEHMFSLLLSVPDNDRLYWLSWDLRRSFTYQREIQKFQHDLDTQILEIAKETNVDKRQGLLDHFGQSFQTFHDVLVQVMNTYQAMVNEPSTGTMSDRDRQLNAMKGILDKWSEVKTELATVQQLLAEFKQAESIARQGKVAEIHQELAESAEARLQRLAQKNSLSVDELLDLLEDEDDEILARARGRLHSA